MKKKQIYIIVSVILGVGLLIWLISYFSKNRSNQNKINSTDAGNDLNYDLELVNVFDENEGGGSGSRVGEMPLETGYNVYENPNYNKADFLPPNYMGFNSFDGTSPRSNHVPLTVSRSAIYSMPYRQGAGIIKNF